jgi:hypothetical protein
MVMAIFNEKERKGGGFVPFRSMWLVRSVLLGWKTGLGLDLENMVVAFGWNIKSLVMGSSVKIS